MELVLCATRDWSRGFEKTSEGIRGYGCECNANAFLGLDYVGTEKAKAFRERDVTRQSDAETKTHKGGPQTRLRISTIYARTRSHLGPTMHRAKLAAVQDVRNIVLPNTAEGFFIRCLTTDRRRTLSVLSQRRNPNCTCIRRRLDAEAPVENNNKYQ